MPPSPPPDLTGRPVVATSRGLIAGTYLFNGTVESYLGVPYATPPTGALRWRAPQPAPPWTAPLVAASSPPACPQRLGEPPLHSQDEDCLYLNVVAPTRSSTLHPVLVYIHGGSYVQGGVAEDRLNASWAVARRRDLVVVTLQYRLGLLGWLGGSRLDAESNQSGASGNYGLLDQRLALAWVQSTVRAFGGDPQRVLVAGQSAGAGAVSAHLVSRGSRGLFSRAALLSGAFASWVSQSAAGAQAVYGTLAAAAGCASNVSASAELSCLRGLSADALLAALPPEWEDFGPTVGGAELPAPPSHLAAAGALAPGVPIVAGSTEEDGTPHLPAAASASDFDAWVGAEFGVSSLNYTTARQALLKTLYDPAAERRRPDGAHSAAYWSQIHLLADAEMACPAIRTARWRGAAPKAGTTATAAAWVYVWAHVRVAAAGRPDGVGADHSSELPFLFGVEQAHDPRYAIHGDGERDLAANFLAFLRAFADGGAPNYVAGGAPGWPAYDDAAGQRLVLQAAAEGGIKVEAGGRRKECALWDAVGDAAPENG